MNNKSTSIKNKEEYPLSFLGSWKNVYGLVLLNLVVLIFLFYLVTWVFE